MMNAISIALSGLQAATKRLSASASNIANLQTVGSLEEGGQKPYSSLTTTQSAQNVNGQGSGVTANIAPKNTPFVPAYSPDSPFANEDGLIGVPNTDLAEEAVYLNLAETTYKAGLKTIETQKELDEELLSILDEKA